MKFKKFLETVNIKEEEKLMLLSLNKNVHNTKDCNFNKILLKGHSGTGKTKLAKEILASIKVPVIYFGLEAESHYLNCKNSSEVLKTAEKHEKCAIFIDNIETIMKDEHRIFGGMAKEDEKNLLKIMDLVDKSQNRALILTTIEGIPSEELQDRLDIQISMDLPTTDSKKRFIKNRYNSILQEDHIEYISKKTPGYTFRDIESVIKRLTAANQAISMQQIKETLTKYVPSALSRYDIIHVTDLNLRNIVGRKNIQEQLKRVITSLNYRELASKLGIQTKNLLFFYGEPGTGKTFMAKAIAGELGLPIISINSSHINSHSRDKSPFENLKEVLKLGSRFGDSIILFDEAEKTFGRSILGEDTNMQGDLQSYLDGVGKKLKSLIIFTLNEQARFGEPLKDRFLMFKFELPNTEERTEFLKRKQNPAKTHFTMKFDIKELAGLMKNSSFREIEKIWDQTLLKKLITEDKTISLKDFEQTIELLKAKKENALCG